MVLVVLELGLRLWLLLGLRRLVLGPRVWWWLRLWFLLGLRQLVLVLVLVMVLVLALAAAKVRHLFQTWPPVLGRQ